MSEFPASWSLLPVSEVVRNIPLTDKKIPQKQYLSRGKFPVFDQGQEYVGGYTDDAAMVVDCDLPVIVFGDHTRAVKLVNTAFAPGADGVKVLQPSTCILPKLLEHFVRYLVTKIPNNGYSRHYQHLAKSLLPIPPLAEQHRIVAKIEELFSELDQGVASLKTAREQLKVYRQSLLKNAFEGKLTAAWRAAHRNQLETATALQQRIARERHARYQQQLADWQSAGQPGPKPKPPKPLPPLTTEELAELPELPAGWRWVKLGSLASQITDGEHFRPTTTEQGIPFLSAKDVRADGVSFDAPLFISLETAEKAWTRCQPERSDILIVSRGATVGRMCAVNTDQPFCLLGSVILIKVTPATLPAYLLAALKTPFVNKKIVGASGATAQQAIYLRDIQTVPVAVCSLAEQFEIVQELESKLSEAGQLDQTLATALQQADALRQSILKKAFHGQLVKQAKNEEPATALLERIRAGKANGTEKAGKRGKAG